MNKKKDRRSLLDDKRAVIVISLVLALIAWVIVAGFINPSQDTQIDNVPINYSTGMDNYKNRGLEIVGEQRGTATVTVHGDGADINALLNTDVIVYCDYSSVVEPGTYEIPLRAAKAYNSGNWAVTGVRPQYVTLTFEAVSSTRKTLQVQADGITAAEGYYRGEPVYAPLQVDISGPESEMALVEGAVVVIPDTAERTTNYTYSDAAVQLVDANGDILQSSLITIEPATITVEIPILPIKELPISVDFSGTPPSFDTAWFRSLLSFSEATLRVAGEESVLEGLDSLEINYLDVASFEVEDESVTVQVSLPEGLVNVDNITQIEITLDSATLAQRSFDVPLYQNENITVRSAPVGVSVTPVGVTSRSESFAVSLVGPEEVIASLVYENIVVEIDASGVTLEGGRQQDLAVRVYVPLSRRVYAVEVGTITCNVTAS